jgi:hypothetical protein
MAFQSINGTYNNVVVYEDGGTASGSAQTPTGYGAPAQMSFSNLSSSTLSLPVNSLTLFCVELGQDSTSSAETYQILDANSLSYVNSTNLAVTASDPSGTPDPMTTVSSLESDGGITPTGGIGTDGYRANEISLLYGFAFGANGKLSSGYNLTGVSIVNQVAFQLAVWKLAYEGTSSSPASLFPTPTGSASTGVVTSSGLSVTGVDAGVINEANSLLASVYNNNNGLGITPMAIDALNNGTYQDFLIPASSFTEIPEPATSAAILGLAALALGLYQRLPAVRR